MGYNNRLTGIGEKADSLRGHQDNGLVNDYTYHADGSLKTDGNKGITDIIYNYLGLPEEILFGANKKIKNLYAADGQKLSQLLINDTDTLKTDYVGGLLYKNDVLTSILHDEGRVKVAYDTTVTTWADTLGNSYADTLIAFKTYYEYFITDHLGNTRISFSELNDSLYIAQEQHYYPFGAMMEGLGVVADSSDKWDFLYQGKELVDGWGYDFHTRGYNQYLGRFMQVDGANQFASGYVGMGNNPVSYIDPDGQFAFLPFVAYAAIGVGVNGIINSAREKPFFQNWGSAAVSGALSGGYLSAVGAGISGHLPSYNLDLGGGFGIGISPAIAFGNNGFNIGANVGLNYSSEYFSAGAGVGVGYTNMRLDANTAKGFASSIAGGFSAGSKNWNIGLHSSKFSGAGIGQQVAGIGLTLGGVRAIYENDGAPFSDWLPNTLNDGGDRFRTAAVSLGYGDVDVRLSMFTGDSYGEVDPEATTEGHPIFGLKTGGGDDYRLGALSLGYNGNRIGWNSEAIRHVFQNKFAHNIVKPQGYFKVLPSGIPGSLYTSTTRFNNPYSLWTF